jgi:hypothetical protein
MTSESGLNDDDATLLARYRQVLEQWERSQDNANKANKLYAQAQAYAKELRLTEDGRAGIRSLMSHPDGGVRLLAAAHTLTFEPTSAVPVLEELETGLGLASVSAKYTLRSYRKGTLYLDW